MSGIVETSLKPPYRWEFLTAAEKADVREALSQQLVDAYSSGDQYRTRMVACILDLVVRNIRGAE